MNESSASIPSHAEPAGAAERPRRRRRRWILACEVVVGLVGAGAAVWRLLPESVVYLTDADTIRARAGTVPLREVLWRPPVALADGVNSAADDYEPRLSADGTTLYFVRGKAGRNADIYTASRTPSGWSGPKPIDAVNSPHDDFGPEPSADGATLYFYSNRPGGHGGHDLWVSRRDDAGEFGEPANLGPLVNSAYNDYGPSLATDGRTLYFASNRPGPAEPETPSAEAWPATVREDLYQRNYDIYAAPVTDRGVGRPVAAAELNSPHNEGTPAASPAGDFLYFSSDRPGGAGGFDLYRSRCLGGKHLPPEHLGATVNTPDHELDPALSMDGHALHFSSDRPRDPGTDAQEKNYDLFRTSSREVFTETERAAFAWGELWTIIGPSLLWVLLTLLLLWLLRRMLGGVASRKLGLLARCALASLVAHLVLMSLLSLWNVKTSLVGLMRRGGTRVALASPASGHEIAAQLRGGFAEFNAPAPPPTDNQIPRSPRLDVPSTIDAPTDAAPARINASRPVRIETFLDDAPAPPARSPLASAIVAPAGSAEEMTIATPADAAVESVDEPAGQTTDPLRATRPELEALSRYSPPVTMENTRALRLPAIPSITSADLPMVSTPISLAASSADEDRGLPIRRIARAAPVAPEPRDALVLALPSTSVDPPVAEQHDPPTPEAVYPAALDLQPATAMRLDAPRPLSDSSPPAGPSRAAETDTSLAAVSELDSRRSVPPTMATATHARRIPTAPPVPTPAWSLPDPASLAVADRIFGRVHDSDTGELLAGATVRLDRTDQAAVSVTTDADGLYELSVPEVPEFFAVSASAEDYLPASANVAAADVSGRTLRLDFELHPAAPTIIAIEAVPDVHHLGDDRFNGSVNSQFQKRSEGATFSATFDLGEGQVSSGSSTAQVSLLAKGVQMRHPLYMNGRRLRHRLSRSPRDGSFGEWTAPFDAALLRPGVNTFEIRARSRGDDVDDFEFVNAQIHLVRGRSTSSRRPEAGGPES